MQDIEILHCRFNMKSINKQLAEYRLTTTFFWLIGHDNKGRSFFGRFVLVSKRFNAHEYSRETEDKPDVLKIQLSYLCQLCSESS